MIVQGTEEWKKLRAGKVTASRVKDVIAKTKTGYSTSREKYLIQLAIERFGVIGEGFTNAAMIHGTETEPFARHEYEIRNDVMVDEVDFINHKTIPMAGASPDGIVEDGLVEIKCPDQHTHCNYLIDGVVPEVYKPQMAWQMACTGAKWCDFVSYDPRCPEGLQYFQIRYERDEKYIAELEQEVIKFLAEVDDKYETLKQKIEPQQHKKAA